MKDLSGGELKKLEFCLCMVMQPKLILLDEPFAGLDPKTTKLVASMITKMRKENIGFLIVDHRIQDLKHLATGYVLLGARQVIFQGSKAAFFKSRMVKEEFLGDYRHTKIP